MKNNPPSLESTDSSEEDIRMTVQTNSKVVESSNLQASFTLFKSFIGTGVLALPYAFKVAGPSLAILVMIIIAFMLSHCFLLLLKTADDRYQRKKVSFQQLALDTIGQKGSTLVQILLIIEQLGCCIGVLIFTKDFLDYLFCSFQVSSLCGNVGFNIIFAMILTVPLSLINNMHYFYLPSLAANFFIILGLFTQMYYNFQVASEDPTFKSTLVPRLAEFNFTNLSLFFGVAMFSYEGVGVTFSIRDSMEKPQDLSRLLKNQIVVLTGIYIVFSAMSYLVLGHQIPDIVFFSLPVDQPAYLFIQILYNASVLLSYPIQLFPALRIIEEFKCFKSRLFNEAGRSQNKALRYALRFAVIGVIFFIAYTAQSFHLFLNLLGSCVFTLLGFSVPIWLYMTHFKTRLATKEKLLNYGILITTAVFGVIGVVQSFAGLLGLNVEDTSNSNLILSEKFLKSS